jgi:L-fuconate dehydratase
MIIRRNQLPGFGRCSLATQGKKGNRQVSEISALETYDIRFPTSRSLDGSDAMNPDPDYSAAYVVLRTNDPGGLCGHGFAFTIGRGNDVQRAACAALRDYVVGRDVARLVGDLGACARRLTGDSQLRWLGPEKGVMHMAIGAVINAAWDLAARRAGKPLWRFVADMTPEEIVDCIDFRYLEDALSVTEALEILRRNEPGKSQRTAYVLSRGYPAYSTTPGWLGYPDEKMVRLAREAVDCGFRTVKLKVGLDLDDDVRRCRLVRETVGPEVAIAADANQRWGVEDAINWIRHLAPFHLAWVEKPTSPDDVLAHRVIRDAVAPTPISTGERKTAPVQTPAAPSGRRAAN